MDSPESPRRRTSGDEGVTLILFALAMVAILFMVAIVIDLSNVRNSRQDNKLLADAATTAGLQSLAPDGDALPWQAVCTALEYLEANEADLTLSVEYRDGSDPPNVLVGNPCASLRNQECVPLDRTTWAWIHAVAGEHTYDIKSGYVMSEDNFPEDQVGGAYNSDVGDPDYGGCDQVAVISSKTDDALFGGIGGVTDYDTALRSVGRADIGKEGKVAIALVLLEQNDCQVLDFAGGGQEGQVTVRGTGDRPGIIHSDSAGTGDDCGRPVLVGKQNAYPRVRALAAPFDSAEYGIISTYHAFQGGMNDASWTKNRDSQDTEVWVCDPDSPEAIIAGPSPCDEPPTGADRVTRTPADDRYLPDVTAFRQEAKAIFTELATNPIPSTWTRYTSLGYSCNLTGGATSPNILAADVPDGRLYVDCPTGLTVGTNKSFTVESGVDEIAFEGTIGFGNGTLELENPRKVYVLNTANASTAVNTGSQGQFIVNRKESVNCEARNFAESSEVTEFVIRSGALTSGAGATLRMCSTFVHMMGGPSAGAQADAPVDVNRLTPTPYPEPYDNSYNGAVSVGGGGTVDWTAPNTKEDEPTSETYRFEDLALWTETQATSTLSGGGTMTLSGIFFLPNATVAIGGTPGGVINFDAQLWVRKLAHNGNAVLRMKADPEDSIPVPFLEGLALVR
jgi:hypothetical protein